MNKKFGDETKRSEPGSVSRRTLMATASAAATSISKSDALAVTRIRPSR
jgi:hypothetical protein